MVATTTVQATFGWILKGIPFKLMEVVCCMMKHRIHTIGGCYRSWLLFFQGLMDMAKPRYCVVCTTDK